MTSRPDHEYLFYRLTRTKESIPEQQEPVTIGLPDLDPREFSRLREVHSFFKDNLTFAIGQTRTVPLTYRLANQLRAQKWTVETRGHGRPVNDQERELINFCESRHKELASTRRRLWARTIPLGEYGQAGFVGKFPKVAEIGDELEALNLIGGLKDEATDSLRKVVSSLRALRANLEAKGWQFEKDGTVHEPSTGGRPSHFPRSAIRAYYRVLAIQYLGSRAPADVVERIQRDLKPVLGDLTSEEIREAIKYESQRPGTS